MAHVKAAFISGIAVSAIFVTSLWFPTIDNLFNIAPSLTGNEKSSLSQLPGLKPDRKSIVEFHNKFVKYFIDNFGFRNTLIRWNSLLKLKLLKTDQFPKVLVGKDEWLYLIKDDEGNNALEFYRAVKPFQNDKELAAWVQPLTDLNSYFKKKGVKFLVIFTPMKTRIYPEFIPAYLKPVMPVSRLGQLEAYLRRNTDIDFIDLGEALLEGKKNYRVYLKHDVHWNTFGAYFGYREIAEKLKRHYPKTKIRTLEEYRVETDTFQGGDLASMLGLKDQFSERNFKLIPKYALKAVKLRVEYQIKGSRATEIFSTADPSLPKAVVYHDSFFIFLMSNLSENFNRMACFQSYNRVDITAVEREKPDIVLYELAESFAEKSPAYVTPLNLY
jgi:alginate O-acetyltransferase complex protein AlgJ